VPKVTKTDRHYILNLNALKMSNADAMKFILDVLFELPVRYVLK